jgi:plasmid stabilization system protein ParE
MKYKIIVEPEAQNDLQTIYNYIAIKDSKTKAVTFITELYNSIKSLEEMPFRCRNTLYTDDKDTRDLIYKGYTIVFKVIDKNVHILSIFRQRAY